MALHYVLDGYNIVKQIPSLAMKNLRNGREKLVSLIEKNRPQGSLNNIITVVYDGKSGISHRQEPSIIKTIYSQSESADDTIRTIVSRTKNKKEMIVVTDDKELRFSVRALGARVESVEKFLTKARVPKIERKAKEIKKMRSEEKKSIPKDIEYKINDELEKIWLR